METQTMSVHDRLSKHILADGYPLVMDVEKSHGSYIVYENGDEYSDMFSLFGYGFIWYNHPHLVKNIVLLGKMAVNKPTLSDIYAKEYADYIDTFGRVAIPEELSYALFVSGGALAVENALEPAF